MAREIDTTGLVRNGARWWLRTLRSPSTGRTVRRSTGTADTTVATRVRDMVRVLSDVRQQWDLLERAFDGTLALDRLYLHYSAGTLEALRRELTQAAAPTEPDLEPLVDRWRDEHLAARDLSGQQRLDYVRQLRVLIPAGVAFPVSRWSEATIKAKLAGLRDPRSGEPLSGSTKRRYVAAWRVFHRWARKQVAGLVDPFDDADWLPQNAAPRAVYWDHETRMKVLAKLTGEVRACVALALGSGMERVALAALRESDIGADRTVVAHGTKNGFREDRTIFVDAWAWAEFRQHRRRVAPTERVFGVTMGKVLRALYQAQVDAGLIDKPESSDSYKPLWKAVNPHTLHDCRHTFAVCRALGLDGEARQTARWIAYNLGHADEQMVLRIYAKARIEDRLRLLELAEAKRQGAQEAREVA